MSHELRLYGTVQDTIVDGPGLRYAVFVQGCTHHCPGCHNPESQPAEGGTLRTVSDILADIRANPLIHDVTLTGGEPFQQPAACASLARHLKAKGYGVWTYTGYRFEDLLDQPDPAIHDLISHSDVIVDGPFVESLKSLDLEWRGSSNQRLIDVPKTLDQGTIIEWTKPTITYTRPPSW